MQEFFLRLKANDKRLKGLDGNGNWGRGQELGTGAAR